MKKLSKLKLNSLSPDNLTYREMKGIFGGTTYIPLTCGCACTNVAADDNCLANCKKNTYSTTRPIVEGCRGYAYYD